MKGLTRENRDVQRVCLKCDRPFMAVGWLNRVCPGCTEGNKRFSGGLPEMTMAYKGGRTGKRWPMGGNTPVRMVLVILGLAIVGLLCLSLAGCGGDSRSSVSIYQVDYDPVYELEQMRGLVLETFPDIESLDDWEMTVIFRDHIHWITFPSREYLGFPMKAEYYLDLLEGRRGAMCFGMSAYLCACLQAFDVPFRFTQIWTGRISEEWGSEIGHSVVEVWVYDHWELHDPSFNICWMLDGEILSAQEIKDALDAGLSPTPSTNGYEAGRAGRTIEGFEDRFGFPYFDYFNRIDYRWEAVFF